MDIFKGAVIATPSQKTQSLNVIKDKCEIIRDNALQWLYAIIYGIRQTPCHENRCYTTEIHKKSKEKPHVTYGNFLENWNANAFTETYNLRIVFLVSLRLCLCKMYLDLIYKMYLI